MLDISCGDGSALSELKKRLPAVELHGIDVQEHLIRQAQHNYSWGTFVAASADTLPYENERFIALLSLHSLHHYENPLRVFQEAARVLKQGGTLYIVDSMPWFRFQQLFWNWDGCSEPYHFEQYYTVTDIKHLAAQSRLLFKRQHMLSLADGEKLVVLQKQEEPARATCK